MYFEVMTSTSLNKIPTKNILKDVSPWPKEYSNEFLRLNELSLLFTRTNCDEDENEPFYFFATPDESVLWPNGKPVCPKCEKAGYPSTLTKIHAYEAKARQIEDIPFRGKKSIIAILYKTYRCTHCADQGITTIIRPAYTFVEKNGKLTKRHIEKIKAASLGKTSFEQVAYQMQVDAKTVKKLFKEEVLRRQKECKFATPKHLGIDEAKVHTAGKSTFYVCLMNTDPNAPEHNGIVDILQMKQTTEETVKLLSRFDDPGTVETISMDMCSAYRTAAETVFPKARIIVDRFHLVQSLNNKFKECLSLLYADYKDTLEKRLKITPSCHSGDTFLDDDEKVIEEEAALLRADLDMAYEHIENCDITTIPLSDLSLEEATETLTLLKENYNYKWFVMNPQNLSKVSQVKFHKFLTTFPEFLQLYRMKELLRYDFFHAETKADAKKIASQAYELLQSLGKNNVLGALHTYFKTLNHSNWTPHIYSYFDDPMEQRYSNAKLESLNQLVKDVNRISKGLYWDDLKAKLLYGDLSVKPRPARHPRKKEELTTFHMKCVTDWLDQPRQMAHFPSLSSWEVFFSAPKVRSALTKNGSSLVHFSEQSLTDKVLELRQNNNVPYMVQHCISHLEVSELKASPKVINRLSDDEMHDIEVISPLQFADWTVNKENYLAQIAADCKFLSSANKK